jgi:hypothetical protein
MSASKSRPSRNSHFRIIDWRAESAKHGLIPGCDPQPEAPAGFESFGAIDIERAADEKFDPDPSLTNATSIGFYFEYDGIRIVFSGDTDDARLIKSLRTRAEAEGGRLRLDALKVAHHGSRRNISTAFLSLIDCRRYLISTNGARHGHPNETAMARILKYGGVDKEIAFNYRDRARRWDVAQWRQKYRYRILAPADAAPDGALTSGEKPRRTAILDIGVDADGGAGPGRALGGDSLTVKTVSCAAG